MPRTRMAHPEFEMASHGDGAAAAVAALGISDPEAGTTGRRCGGISRCSPPTSPYPTKFYGNTVELAKLLLSEGQSHLFEHWPEPGVDDDKKRNFFDQKQFDISCDVLLPLGLPAQDPHRPSRSSSLWEAHIDRTCLARARSLVH
uniref:Uncharacterized protein n=1 Tax=Oryza meridionalis TaxID=40149 RepID=A0A0E0CKG3_9ORYZ